ncbi:hypothetical protein Q5P01_014705 [Channa striata]|uniref:Uncharacterized protein n=1 Tax=Channa striata TaxID=64152 RepID=A0AA88MJ80_CHASR|nr:hypothetical protein Q5P01_014705 [Channa striata]
MEMSGWRRQKRYLVVTPILFFPFSPPPLTGFGHPVMCGACTATIPSGSRLSVYRLLAGVYYAEGRLSHGNPDSFHKLQKHHCNQVRRVSGHDCVCLKQDGFSWCFKGWLHQRASWPHSFISNTDLLLVTA